MDYYRIKMLRNKPICGYLRVILKKGEEYDAFTQSNGACVVLFEDLAILLEDGDYERL